MNIHDLLQKATEAAHTAARSQGILTLGELRAALASLPDETLVLMDSGKRPTQVASYRGYYERLAISDREYFHSETKLINGGPGCGDYCPGAQEVQIAQPATAGEVVKALNLAESTDFEGYKGGQYTMHAETLMHAAKYSDTGQMIVGLQYIGEVAIIQTANEEW